VIDAGQHSGSSMNRRVRSSGFSRSVLAGSPDGPVRRGLL